MRRTDAATFARSNARRDGFTLLECTIAMAVIATALLGFSSAIVSSKQVVASGKAALSLHTEARKSIEQMRAMQLSEILAAGPIIMPDAGEAAGPRVAIRFPSTLLSDYFLGYEVHEFIASPEQSAAIVDGGRVLPVELTVLIDSATGPKVAKRRFFLAGRS